MKSITFKKVEVVLSINKWLSSSVTVQSKYVQSLVPFCF